jgi:hypothetical protein
VKTPFAVGAVMAALMLWMLHDRIMSGDAGVIAGAAQFILAHVGIAVALAGVTLLFPLARKAALRHRPSLGHLVGMSAGMAASAATLHAVIHGAFA